MYNSIRELLTTNVPPRIETGPTRVGNDHCGLFIRGDDCFHYAMHLESILTKREDRVDKLSIIALRELLELLRSTNESPSDMTIDGEMLIGNKTIKATD